MSQEYLAGLVSVIIPTFNRAQFLVEAVDSVFAQTYRPIELIVVDDGSTDNTREVVKEWGKKCSSDDQFEFHYLYQKNSGGSAARNHGIIKSRGSYIQFLDSDDLLSPCKLANQVNILSSSDDQIAVYGPVRYFKNTKNYFDVYAPYSPRYKVDDEKPLIKWLKGEFIPSHSLLWKREDVDRLGPWDEKLAADQDGEYAMRFLASGGKLLFCEQAWVYYRKDPNYNPPGDHVSNRKSAKAIRSRILVTHRFEKFLASRNLLDDEYRTALSRRYYGIAKYYAYNHKMLKRLCLRYFERLSPVDFVPPTVRNPVLSPLLIKFLGFGFSGKIRHFYNKTFGIPVFQPKASVKSIEELCTFDQ